MFYYTEGTTSFNGIKEHHLYCLVMIKSGNKNTSLNTILKYTDLWNLSSSPEILELDSILFQPRIPGDLQNHMINDAQQHAAATIALVTKLNQSNQRLKQVG